LLIARWLPAQAEPPHAVQEITVLIHEAPPPPPPVVPEPPPPPVKFTPPKLVQAVTPSPEPLPPPDPIDLQPPPPEAPPPPPVRRVVGLSLESTVVGGAGPAVAVGNTRMGQTAPIAADPSVEPLRQELTPARRLTDEKPEYPQELRARGVEGDVELQVELDAQGLITRATVVTSSGFPAFDASAVASARRATYEAAKLNGVAVAQVLRFTVRFRLRQ
jgi:protein TonB